ncbi:MAG: tRNA lysidine(34) synthetase TilS [Alphaproteobacteria bacterium]|nr:tRNA lysidine(34) synthetase TilS [Alphaproteobacteria bacterium]
MKRNGMGVRATTPLTDSCFAKAMAAFAPYEYSPTLAVALSGGRDSLALALLAKSWTDAQKGKLVTLTVDHGLRSGSAKEAGQVKTWMAERNIEHHTLTWQGEKPSSALQEQARKARYMLLEEWCRSQNILHLLLGHHFDDQKETYQLRKNKGSGPDGLAAMAPVIETRNLRLLRPLLGVDRETITATLKELAQEWIDDPSNEDSCFERVRVRKSAQSGEGDFDALHLLRREKEEAIARELAKSTFFHPFGYAEVGLSNLTNIDESALSRIILSVGGGIYGPRRKNMKALFENLISKKNKTRGTLGRCVVSRKRDLLSIWRENRNFPQDHEVLPGEVIHWDRRYKVTAFETFTLRPLGEEGLAQLKQEQTVPFQVMRAALITLPACWDEKGLLAAPLLGYIRGGSGESPRKVAEMAFSPAHPLLGIGLRLA